VQKQQVKNEAGGALLEVPLTTVGAKRKSNGKAPGSASARIEANLG